MTADNEPAAVTDVPLAAAKADDVPATKSKSRGTIALGLAGSGALPVFGTAVDRGTSFVAAISNPYALGGFIFSVLAIAVLAWLVLSGRITINRSKAL